MQDYWAGSVTDYEVLLIVAALVVASVIKSFFTDGEL